MRPKTRLRRHLEPGWVLEVPGEGAQEDPLTGRPLPSSPTVHPVSVSIQQRMLTGMTETGVVSVLDEREAIILPDVPGDPLLEVPATAALYSPRGECWNAAGDGIIRRTARRRGMYTVVSVRRAKEGDR